LTSPAEYTENENRAFHLVDWHMHPAAIRSTAACNALQHDADHSGLHFLYHEPDDLSWDEDEIEDRLGEQEP
jgi:hypothetical protein